MSSLALCIAFTCSSTCFQARLPSFLVSPLTLRPDVSLLDAALRMATMVKGGG